MTKNYPLLLIIIAFVFPQFIKSQAQQYTVGTPVNDTLYYLQPYSQSANCMYDVDVLPNIFTVTGVELYMVIDTLVDASGNTLVNPGGNINIGDTLFLPSSSASGGYQFKFNGGPFSSALCRLMARGSPTITGESYLCDNYATLMSSAVCENYMNMMGATSCQVQPSSSLDLQSEIKDNYLIIYPNPANNSITINFNKESVPYRVEIYSSIGLLVKEINAIQHLVKIDIQMLPKGLYTLLIKNQKGKVYSNKIIKQ